MDTSRYQNGCIYKLCCRDTAITDIYVGSTCNFTKRTWQHKSRCNNENSKKYNINVYQFIRDHGGWENWEMIELIKYPCNTKRELELKEREYLELLGGTLNKYIPARSSKEYYEENKEHICETTKAYRQKNKETILEKQRAHYEANKEEINEKRREKVNCDCGGRYSKSSKIQHLKSPKHQKFLNEIKE
jgi:hypothetical protein